LVTHQRGLTKVYYRAGSESPWEKLVEYPLGGAGWLPLMLDDDDHTLYVSSRSKRDKSAIFSYDTKSKSLGAMVASHPQVDLENLIADDQDNVVGVTFDADRPGVAWFDERIAHIQEAIDASLPNAVNRISWSLGLEMVLVASQSDVSPGSSIFSIARPARWRVGGPSPWIKSELCRRCAQSAIAPGDGPEIRLLDRAARLTGQERPGRIASGGPWVSVTAGTSIPRCNCVAATPCCSPLRGTTRYGWKHFLQLRRLDAG
jgi:hypothetical protein